MSDRSWWSHAAQWGLWFLVMTVVMGWIGSTRLRKRGGRNANIMEYPISMLATGLACGGMFLVVSVLCTSGFGRVGSALERLWFSLAFLGIACLGVFPIAEYFLVRHELEPDGIRYKTVFGRRGFIRWEDVTAVRYSHLAKWFRIDTSNGDLVRISAMLLSLPEFATAVLETVPRWMIESDTERVLEETASGSPPPLF